MIIAGNYEVEGERQELLLKIHVTDASDQKYIGTILKLQVKVHANGRIVLGADTHEQNLIVLNSFWWKLKD